MTHSIEILVAASQAIASGAHMQPRSSNDKEYFPQDWFADRVVELALPHAPQGRNSYPDFWVGDQATPPVEGYEVKSLKFAKGKPARRDYDSNSTIPSGRKDGRDIFLVFFLYTGSGSALRPVHSLSIAHADLINADHDAAAAHVNEGIDGFGSYGDGFIRDRKMYRFPQPYSIDPSGLGRCRLIVPSEWALSDARLNRCGTIERVVADESLEKVLDPSGWKDQGGQAPGCTNRCRASPELRRVRVPMTGIVRRWAGLAIKKAMPGSALFGLRE